MGGAWPKRSVTRVSGGFAWTLRLLAAGTLGVLAYQLTNGGLCTTRHGSWVCMSGRPAVLIALGFAFFAGWLVAITLPKHWGPSLARVCLFLMVASFLAGAVLNNW